MRIPLPEQSLRIPFWQRHEVVCSRTCHILQLVSCLCDRLEETATSREGKSSYRKKEKTGNRVRNFPKRTMSDGSEPSFYFIYHLTKKFRQKKQQPGYRCSFVLVSDWFMTTKLNVASVS